MPICHVLFLDKEVHVNMYVMTGWMINTAYHGCARIVVLQHTGTLYNDRAVLINSKRDERFEVLMYFIILIFPVKISLIVS